jgi:DNA-binding YbaB/EbfC family protein
MAKGFKSPKGPMGGNPMGMMGQLQKLQEQVQQAQEQLALETVSETAGGGAVKITVTGAQVLTDIWIDPDLLKDADAEMLQDLLLTAVNKALDASRAMAATRLGPMASGLPF